MLLLLLYSIGTTPELHNPPPIEEETHGSTLFLCRGFDSSTKIPLKISRTKCNSQPTFALICTCSRESLTTNSQQIDQLNSKLGDRSQKRLKSPCNKIGIRTQTSNLLYHHLLPELTPGNAKRLFQIQSFKERQQQ
jgi:hypothetical protein